MKHQAAVVPTESLDALSQQVANEYLAGQWEHVAGKPWKEVRTFLLDELLERCPGFSTRDYRIALNKSLAGRIQVARRNHLSRAILAASLASAIILAATGCKGKPTVAMPDSSSRMAATSVRLERSVENRVEVGSDGFRPSSVALGTHRTVVFRRISDATCATAVTFPSLGITKQLPLDTDVAVDVPAAASSDLSFQCGMGMFRGKVVAR
jgi:plastocyanin domain-containing protein